MKILYDHQIFTLQRYGGISRYFYELFWKFSSMDEIDIDVSLLFSNNYYISSKEIVKHRNFFLNQNFKGKNRLMNIFNNINSISYLRRQNFNIFHPTYYSPYFLKYLGKKPFVITVHDMIHEKFKNMFPKNDKTTQYKKILVNKASKIIAISQNTKNDLIDVFNVKSEKIEVVYLGNSLMPKNIKTNIEIPQKYILFVGSRRAYKNFDLFLESVVKIFKKNKNLYLLCAGGGSFNEYEKKMFEKLGIKNQVIQFNFDDDTLAYIYKNAILFVFPSLYEGFGIPILEAFACNCPVVCSNTSSLPEVGGEAAYYFDPYNKDSIKSSIERVFFDDELRNKMIQKGKNRLKMFSWENTALKTKKIYESVLS